MGLRRGERRPRKMPKKPKIEDRATGEVRWQKSKQGKLPKKKRRIFRKRRKEEG